MDVLGRGIFILLLTNLAQMVIRYCILPILFIVKLQSKLNSPVQVGQGVDFVFPLSQQEQEQEQQKEHSHKDQSGL